eukprot:996760-Prorocentrum_minimum.AAC.1
MAGWGRCVDCRQRTTSNVQSSRIIQERDNTPPPPCHDDSLAHTHTHTHTQLRRRETRRNTPHPGCPGQRVAVLLCHCVPPWVLLCTRMGSLGTGSTGGPACAERNSLRAHSTPPKRPPPLDWWSRGPLKTPAAQRGATHRPPTHKGRWTPPEGGGRRVRGRIPSRAASSAVHCAR